MRYLGIDYGTSRVGIAVSDDAGSFAFPKTTLDNDAKFWSALKKIIADEKIEELVVGDTRTITGEKNTVTDKADAFVATLETETGKKVHRAREAWSSREAARYAPEGTHHDDASAAAIILQRFLDVLPQQGYTHDDV